MSRYQRRQFTVVNIRKETLVRLKGLQHLMNKKLGKHVHMNRIVRDLIIEKLEEMKKEEMN